MNILKTKDTTSSELVIALYICSVIIPLTQGIASNSMIILPQTDTVVRRIC